MNRDVMRRDMERRDVVKRDEVERIYHPVTDVPPLLIEGGDLV